MTTKTVPEWAQALTEDDEWTVLNALKAAESVVLDDAKTFRQLPVGKVYADAAAKYHELHERLTTDG